MTILKKLRNKPKPIEPIITATEIVERFKETKKKKK